VKQRARAVLRVVLQLHGPLLTGAAHALRRGLEEAKGYDRVAALRSVTLLGVMLHKAERLKERFMTDAAFKLGQLLAVADAVHVGYCADLRSGDVPPVLLGNSVLSMAQSKPNKALAVLCGRWKPYGAWAKRGDAVRRKAEELEKRGEGSRARAMRTAVSQARRVSVLCSDLSEALPDTPASGEADAFRAELLLGYLAGAAAGGRQRSRLPVQSTERGQTKWLTSTVAQEFSSSWRRNRTRTATRMRKASLVHSTRTVGG